MLIGDTVFQELDCSRFFSSNAKFNIFFGFCIDLELTYQLIIFRIYHIQNKKKFIEIILGLINVYHFILKLDFSGVLWATNLTSNIVPIQKKNFPLHFFNSIFRSQPQNQALDVNFVVFAARTNFFGIVILRSLSR